ncbi:MAG: hypothetical protein DRR42_11200 [Gammaproteobacteria bacterium]|nr:MAG: hypothetical protein DRR42_11200 [Gammaproteobacteria bacterium]
MNDLITLRAPPPKRATKTGGDMEEHFYEAAIMLAYVSYLMDIHPEMTDLEIHPDGEHGKQFDIRGWLEGKGFQLTEPQGTTSYGGRYDNGNRSILVSLKPGLGDVVGQLGNKKIVAECKGGILNTKHSGQKSKLRRGLCEAVGQLLSRDNDGEQQFAVVPKTEDTLRLAERMRPRCLKAGIEIVLLNENGIPA